MGALMVLGIISMTQWVLHINRRVELLGQIRNALRQIRDETREVRENIIDEVFDKNPQRRKAIKLRVFVGVTSTSQGELHKYLDGAPVLSIGCSHWTDSPPLGQIERSPSYKEFDARYWDLAVTRLRVSEHR